MAFVYRQYKGRDVELPLTDEMRNFLIARSKDTMIAECDAVWANLNNRPPDEESDVDVEELESYGDLTVEELKAEIADRNEDREDEDKIQVASNARKPELIAALEEDDKDEDDSTE